MIKCTGVEGWMDFGDYENPVRTYNQKQGFCVQVQTLPKEDKSIFVDKEVDVAQTRFFITDLTNPIDKNIIELIELLGMRFEKIEWAKPICKESFEEMGISKEEVFLVLCDDIIKTMAWRTLKITCLIVN